MNHAYGRSNLILPYSDTAIEKKRARHGTPCHDTLTQIRIHRAAQDVIAHGNFDHLRVPMLYDDHEYYVMERVDTRNPIWLGDFDCCDLFSVNLIMDVKADLQRFWNTLWDQYGFAAWDFQLFLQDDQSVVLLGFDKFGFRRDEGLGAPVDLPVPVPVDEFFRGDCFPRDFRVNVNWIVPRPRHRPRVN